MSLRLRRTSATVPHVVRSGSSGEPADDRGVERLAGLEPIAGVGSLRVGSVLQLAACGERPRAERRVQQRRRYADRLPGAQLGGGEPVDPHQFPERVAVPGEPLRDLPQPLIVGRQVAGPRKVDPVGTLASILGKDGTQDQAAVVAGENGHRDPDPGSGLDLAASVPGRDGVGIARAPGDSSGEGPVVVFRRGEHEQLEFSAAQNPYPQIRAERQRGLVVGGRGARFGSDRAGATEHRGAEQQRSDPEAERLAALGTGTATGICAVSGQSGLLRHRRVGDR